MQTTTEPRYRINDVEELQSDLRRLPNDHARCDHLVEHYPHIPENFWRRCTPTMVLAMDPWQFARVLQYADPVGERATDNAMTGARP